MSKKRVAVDRLIELSHGGSYVSQRGITRLLTDARDNGIPTSFSMASQYRARRARCSEDCTPYGALVHPMTLTLVNGVMRTIYVQHPLAMLYRASQECAPLSRLLECSLARNPSTAESPWGIVLYADEIGHNPIGIDNRKIQSVYWSLLQFGSMALHTEKRMVRCVCCAIRAHKETEWWHVTVDSTITRGVVFFSTLRTVPASERVRPYASVDTTW